MNLPSEIEKKFNKIFNKLNLSDEELGGYQIEFRDVKSFLAKVLKSERERLEDEVDKIITEDLIIGDDKNVFIKKIHDLFDA